MSRIRAGEAYVTISADNARLTQGLKQAKGDIKAFATGVSISIPVSLDSVKNAMQKLITLEDKLLTLKGVSGASGAALSGLEKQAKKLGATTSWTAAEVTDGMVALARMGQSANEISASIRPVMDLAKGLGVSVGDASNMVGASLSQFGLSATDAAHVADVLSKATNGAAISQTELGVSLKYAGTAGAQMGQSLEDVTSMVMTLRNMGYSAEQAGTSLRSFFLAIQDPKKAQAFENMFGVKIKDAEGNFRPVLEILKQASARADELGSSLTSALLSTGIDSQTVGAVGALLGKADQLAGVSTSLKDANGYSNALASTMEAGLGGAAKLTGSALDALSITIAEALQPAAVDALDTVAGLADNLSFLVKENRGAVASIVTTTGKMAALGAATTVASKAFQLLKSGFGAITGATNALSSLTVTGKKAPAPLSGVMTGEGVEAFNSAIQKSNLSAKELSRLFSEIKEKTGGAHTAQKELSKVLQESKKLTKEEADAVASVARRVDAGTVSQNRFKNAVKAAKNEASMMAKTIKAAAASIAAVVVLDAFMEAGRAVYNWFNRAAEKAKEARQEIERAAEVEKQARESRLDKGRIGENNATIGRIINNAKNWNSLSAEEKTRAGQELSDAFRNGLVTAEQRRQIGVMTSNGHGEYSDVDWNNLRSSIRRGAAVRGSQSATAAANEINNVNSQMWLNALYGTTDQSAAALRKNNNKNSDDIRAQSGANVDKYINDALLTVRAVASNSSLSDADKALKIAEAKKTARLKIQDQASRIKAEREGYFGAGSSRQMSLEEKKKYSQAAEGVNLALQSFEETIDSAVSAINYLQEASKEAAADMASMEQKKEGTVVEADDPDFAFLNDNRAYQLGEKRGDEEKVKAEEEKAEASKKAAEAARLLAKETADEAAAKLRSTDIEDVTASQLRNTIQKIQSAEAQGIDQSDNKSALREFARAAMNEASKALDVKSTISSKVFTDSISAAFSVANSSALDYQKQQLMEIQKLTERANQQYNVGLEILSKL